MKRIIAFVVLVGLSGGAVWLCLMLLFSPRPGGTGGSGSGSAPNPNPAPALSNAGSAPVAGAVVSTQRHKGRTALDTAEIDPFADGWETEGYTQAIELRLKQIGDAITKPNDEHRKEVEKMAAADFTSGPLRPPALSVVFSESGLSVLRPAARADSLTIPSGYTGAAGLVKAVAELAAAYHGGACASAKFKTFRVTSNGQNFETLSYYEADGTSGAAAQSSAERGSQTVRIQQSAAWRCRWRFRGTQVLPQLRSIEVTDYEEVTADFPSGTLLADCTAAVLGGNPSFEQHLKWGLNYWCVKAAVSIPISLGKRYGIAVGDANGDGLDDVYVCQPYGLPNRLLVQEPSGRVVDRSAEAGVDFLDATASALFADLDNDGDQDLALAIRNGLVILENDSQGAFAVRVRWPLPEWDTHSLSAIDYDNDSDLDLFLTVASADNRVPFNYLDARNGGRNVLLRNEARAGATEKWAFSDVTEEVGLDFDNFRHSLAAAWEDYDDDGDQDVYIANDYGTNNLFRNDNGQFVDVAHEAGVLDPGSGMSVSWGDFNRDGQIDLYVGNMFSSAGGRISQQVLQAQGGPDARALLLKRFTKGNSLFQNSGGGAFKEVGDQAGVEMGRWAWSSLFVDLNNDGWDDIAVANGFISNDLLDDL
jgi:hypothetical protein